MHPVTAPPKAVPRREVALPYFPGFYESELSAKLDFDQEDYAEEYDIPVEDVVAQCDYPATYRDMAEQWARYFFEEFAYHTGITIDYEFVVVDSPKFYNFTTDRVFVSVPLSELLRVLEYVGNDLDTSARELFTSRDGFISSYAPDWRQWGAPETWDHNQWLAVLRAAVDGMDIADVTAKVEVHTVELREEQK